LAEDIHVAVSIFQPETLYYHDSILTCFMDRTWCACEYSMRGII